MKDWSTEELFEGEDFFVVPEAADCFTVVPDVDGAGETSVFADSSFVRGWTPGSV